jgi:hypothetical protein
VPFYEYTTMAADFAASLVWMAVVRDDRLLAQVQDRVVDYTR